MAKKDKNRYLLPSERENQPETPKKERKGFKKVLKYTGVFFLAIVVTIAVGFAGALITGKFNPEKIYITELKINNQKEYVAISDNDVSYRCKIDFLPAEANQLVLTSKIITGSDLIEELPQVVAGQEFDIKFAKDEDGITKGGEIEIKFLDSSQSSYTTLKVLIDVGLHTNYVTVDSTGTEMEYDPTTKALSTKVPTTITKEYCEEIRISAVHDSMFNSYTGNWSESEQNSIANLNRLKKTILFYDEEDTSILGFGADNKLVVEENLGDDKYYKIRFLSPASSLEPFEFQLYIYKTYHMETLFSEELATSLLVAMKEGSYRAEDIDYATLNAFINAYVYNSASVESKDNFARYVNTNNGLIELLSSKVVSKGTENFKRALNDVLDYVFVGKRVLITVENVVVSDIVNTNTELKIKVLENNTYTIGDVKNTLGVSLATQVGDGETPADPQILFNNLRKLDIILCEKSTLTNITSTDWYNPESSYAYVGVPHYIIDLDGDGAQDDGDALYRRVDDSEEIELEKEIVDGEARWTLKTLSPTPTAGKYFLLYRYRNNDIKDYTITSNDGYSTTKYELKNDMWYSGSSMVKSANTLQTLRSALNDKYAVASIDVTWTKGKIEYNSNVNIKNSKSSTFVLNREDSIYTYDGTQQHRIDHGSSNGVYYTYNDNGEAYNEKGESILGRTFTIGEGSNNTENNVLINPLNEGEVLEYTMVKWFVPYYENIIGGVKKDEHGKKQVVFNDNQLNTAQFYFLPVLEKTYQDNTDGANNYNPIPTKVLLKSVEDSNILGGSVNYFMEIGTGNMSVRALNAMAEELDIPLYAVIIQTNIENEPYFENGDITEPEAEVKYTAPKIVTYHYVAYTYENESESGHVLNVKYYVESLKIYISGEGKNDSGYVGVSDTNIISVSPANGGSGSAQNGYFYISNIDLYNYSENVSKVDTKYPSEEVHLGNKVLLNDGINNLRNLKIALYNYYLGFASGTNKSYVITAAKDDYPGGNSVGMGSISLVSGGASAEKWDNWSIRYEIIASSIGGSDSYSYNFKVDYLDKNNAITPPVTQSASVNFYTQVKPDNIGIIQLKPGS